MNRPTPDPSQEGNSASVPDIGSPPPEGLGVGSWSQRMRKSERRLSMSSAETSGVNGDSSLARSGFNHSTVQRFNPSYCLAARGADFIGLFHEAPLPIPLPTPSSWGEGIHHWAWW